MRKRISIFICLLLTALLVGLPGASALSDSGPLRFNADGSFKIMVIADIQDGAKVSEYALELIEKSLEAENPDLVILLGDNVFGRVLSLQKEANVKRSIDSFMAPIVARGIPFCLVFGNHDGEAAMTNEQQLDYFKTIPGCLAEKGDVTGVGNYSVMIKDSGGNDAANLVFFDSGSYAPKGEGKYAYVEDDQIAWFESMSGDLKRENGEGIPAYVFQHIPMYEIYDVLLEVDKGTKDAVRGHGVWSDRYFILDPKRASGYLGEGPCPPDANNGQFESLEKDGNVVAAFFGHDHVNDFVAHYNGIDFVQTPGTGFNAYGNGDKHGVRIVELNETAPDEYETRMVYFDEISGRKIPAHLQYTGSYVFSIIIICAAALLLLVAIVIVTVKKIHKRGRSKKSEG